MKIPKILYKIAKDLETKGFKALIVGGAVRDFILQKDVKDFDIEVYNIDSLNTLSSILSNYGSVNLVGKSFGVVKLKVDNVEYDFSIPRLERKVAKGHKGFSIKVDGSLDFKEAAKRRDFTINAMAYDILEQKVLDVYGGLSDIKNKTLQIVDKNSFKEDPLRVYRAVQFAARFEFNLSKDTFNSCLDLVQSGALEELPKERVWEEFKKLLLKAKKPSIGLELMRNLGILKYFPELQAIIGVKQNSKYHPEGNVWTHTLMVVDEAAKLRVGDEREDLILMLSALCHDLGKAVTTKVIDGQIRALGHEIKGEQLTIDFLQRLTSKKDLINEVTKLVRYHLMPMQLYKNGAKDGAIRRLSTKVNIKRLERLARADYFGRGGVEKKVFEAGDWLLSRAKALNCQEEPPQNLIKGKDLINLGLKPSAKFKKILNKVYEAQLNGEIKSKEEAINLAKEIVFNNNL